MKQTKPKTVRRFIIGLSLGILIPATQFIVLDKGHQDNLNRLRSLENQIVNTWTAQEGQLHQDPAFAPTTKDPIRFTKDPIRLAAARPADTDPIWATTTY